MISVPLLQIWRLIDPRWRPPVEKVRQDENLVEGEGNDHLIRQRSIGSHVRHHSRSVTQRTSGYAAGDASRSGEPSAADEHSGYVEA